MKVPSPAPSKVAKPKKRRGKRKVRTPDHIRADMSLHHLAYIVVKCGFTIQASTADYGYDAVVAFYGPNGAVETGNIFIQLKATDAIDRFTTAKGIAYSIDMRDFDLWAENPYPVYFVIFDASAEAAYWLYFQKYVQTMSIDPSAITTETLTVHLDPSSRVDSTTPQIWHADKDRALAQILKVNHA